MPKIRIRYDLSEIYVKRQMLTGGDTGTYREIEVDGKEIETILSLEAVNFLLSNVPIVNTIPRKNIDSYLLKSETKGEELLCLDFRNIKHNFRTEEIELSLEEYDYRTSYGINLRHDIGYEFDEEVDSKTALLKFIEIKKDEILVQKSFEKDKSNYNFKLKEIREAYKKLVESKRKKEERKRYNPIYWGKGLSLIFPAIADWFKEGIEDIIDDISEYILIGYIIFRIFLSLGIAVLIFKTFYIVIPTFIVLDLIIIPSCFKSICYDDDDIALATFLCMLVTTILQFFTYFVFYVVA